MERKTLVLIFSKIFFSETFIVSRIQPDTVINYTDLHAKCPLLLSGFKETRIIWTDFFEKHSNIKFHESSPSGRRVAPC